ncbi:sortase [Candidatus Peribacteria bacterium]|jgi:LPXTG-site transpeptidase (sortase) family protein|nr:sortase [Candidatus Peribacteria bacterium]MBT4020768.1 sortase [Candidatus Peribacteria bacterium]MBT4241048.1 sortase [Candidatus Peribacteria bacterium]MBT4474453.1 sortase [Candidatus Peribacteria bacterium]
MLHKHHSHHHAILFLLSVIFIGGALGGVSGALDKDIIFDANALRADGTALSKSAQKRLERIEKRRLARERKAQRSGQIAKKAKITYPMQASTLQKEAEKRWDTELDVGRLVYSNLGIVAPLGRPSDIHWKNKNWRELENQMQYALKNGLALYPHSPAVGSRGQVIIAGHSSAPTLDAIGDPFEDIFAALPNSEVGDIVEVKDKYENTYKYEVTKSKEISASQTSLLLQNKSKSEIIMFTCYPVGTTRNRWAVWARLL